MEIIQDLGAFVKGIPWWVYIVFIYLVNLGIKAMRPRTVSISRVVILPVFFVAWSFYGLYVKLLLGLFSLIPLWFICVALGTYCGIKEVQSWRYQSDHRKGMITIPGNYSTLVLVLVIFGLKFFWGSMYATLPEIPVWVYFVDSMTSGFVSGFFVGRAAILFRRYLKCK